MRPPRDQLLRYPLCALLGPDAVDAWIAAGQEVICETGDVLLQRGGKNSWAYLLLEGQVRVSSLSRRFGELSLGRYHPGDLFGECGLLPASQNITTCRASVPSHLLWLPLAHLAGSLDAYSEVRSNLDRWLRLHELLSFLRGRFPLSLTTAEPPLSILDSLDEETFQINRTVQADGLASDRWFFIEKGRIGVQVGGGRPCVLSKGDCFGERTLAGQPNLPVAVALTDVRCRSLTRERFSLSENDAPNHIGRGIAQAPLAVTKGYPWVGQQEVADCGLAALAMIARTHGLDVTPGELRRHASPGKTGLTLLDLCRVSGTLGIASQGVRIDSDQLGHVTLPAIAHWAEHFVVLYKYGPSEIVVGDPAAGVLCLSDSAFKRLWSGRLLVFPLPATRGGCDRKDVSFITEEGGGRRRR